MCQPLITAIAFYIIAITKLIDSIEQKRFNEVSSTKRFQLLRIC